MEGARRYKREVITQKQQWQMESRSVLPEQAPRFSRSYRPDLAQVDGGPGRKYASLAPPDGHGGKRELLAPSNGHGGKRELLAPPGGHGERLTAAVSLNGDPVKLPSIDAKDGRMSAGSVRDQ